MYKVIVLSGALLLGACSASASNLNPSPSQWNGIEEDWPAPLSTQSPWSLGYFAPLRQDSTQRQTLCARGSHDAFAQWYCQEPAPSISGYADVLAGMGLRRGEALSPNAFFALIAASNSLAIRDVSSLNPRGIVYRQDANTFVVAAAARGANVMEIAATDGNTAVLHFYLLHTQHACDADNTCGLADHFQLASETQWTYAVAYDETDLANTPMDCLRCHQPPGTARRLLMQARDGDADHWLRSDTSASMHWLNFRALHAVSPNTLEDYVGIPGAVLAPVGAGPPALGRRNGNNLRYSR